MVAIAAAILISFLNYLGVKKAGEFQLVFTLLKVAIILGIVCRLLQRDWKRRGAGMEQLCGNIRGRERRDRRLHGGAGGGSVGL